MSKIKYLKVSSLRLHDENPRLKDRTPGRTQKQLAKELIHYKIKNFRELMKSIREGYTDANVITVEKVKNRYIVKDGNRRTTILKLLHGHLSPDGLDLPSDCINMINSIDATWKQKYDTVPCWQANTSEEENQYIEREHVSSIPASTSDWGIIQRTIKKGPSSPLWYHAQLALKFQKNSHLPIDSKYKEKWESDYPLTLLQEAFNKGLTEVLGMSIEEVEKKYPSNIPLELKISLDHLFYDLGIEKNPKLHENDPALTFDDVRKQTFKEEILIGRYHLQHISTYSGDIETPADGTDGEPDGTGGGTGG